MNEFFACPQYAYGIFIITIIFWIVMYIYFGMKGSELNLETIQQSAGDTVMIVTIFGLLGFSWALYSFFRLFMRHPMCDRSDKFGKHSNLNPFASGPK
jgi:magnesium-transporting ATPase (P-type)